MSLSNTIKSIQDIMRRDVGVDGDAQRIGQLVWLLFLKIWNDREQELELLEDDFASPLTDVTWVEAGDTRTAEDLRWSAWAADPEGVTGDKLLAFVNDTLFPAFKGMEVEPALAEKDTRMLRRRLVRSVFEDAYQYMKSGTLLRQVVNKIEADIDFNDATNRRAEQGLEGNEPHRGIGLFQMPESRQGGVVLDGNSQPDMRWGLPVTVSPLDETAHQRASFC